MNIGFVGLGKLGLPCALATERYGGHRVYGTDASETVRDQVTNRIFPHREAQGPELLAASSLEVGDLDFVIRQSEIVFVSVQTPHDPRFEGVTRLPDDRVDFDYSHLESACADIVRSVTTSNTPVCLAIVSTVLPGTLEERILPILEPALGRLITFCYNPSFVAMGTVIPDFVTPEFVLLGGADPDMKHTMTSFYRTVHSAPIVAVDLKTAELIKVAYNTFVGMKLAFANTMMEICDKTGADVDALTGALCQGTKRLLSPRYLQAGMGDGGACHPRDNIAMSFLARKLDLGHDFFESLMLSREAHTDWLADLVVAEAAATGLPIAILGKSFKGESDLTVGSPAILLQHLLVEKGWSPRIYDPHVDGDTDPGRSEITRDPHVYFVATRHDAFKSWAYPKSSVVLDPWGYVPDQPGIRVVPIGRRGASRSRAARRS